MEKKKGRNCVPPPRGMWQTLKKNDLHKKNNTTTYVYKQRSSKKLGK